MSGKVLILGNGFDLDLGMKTRISPLQRKVLTH